MGLMTSVLSVCASGQMQPRKVRASFLSINYIWFGQINYMELFAADRKQVDSECGGGGAVGQDVSVDKLLLCFTLPFFTFVGL